MSPTATIGHQLTAIEITAVTSDARRLKDEMVRSGALHTQCVDLSQQGNASLAQYGGGGGGGSKGDRRVFGLPAFAAPAPCRRRWRHGPTAWRISCESFFNSQRRLLHMGDEVSLGPSLAHQCQPLQDVHGQRLSPRLCDSGPSCRPRSIPVHFP